MVLFKWLLVILVTLPVVGLAALLYFSVSSYVTKVNRREARRAQAGRRASAAASPGYSFGGGAQVELPQIKKSSVLSRNTAPLKIDRRKR